MINKLLGIPNAVELFWLATLTIMLSCLANALMDIAESLVDIAQRISNVVWYLVGKCKELQHPMTTK